MSHLLIDRTAHRRAHPEPVAQHGTGHRARALPRIKGGTHVSRPHVLFVDADDTGVAQIAAVLLARHAGSSVVARSAGVAPGPAVTPYAVKVMTQFGIEPATVAPKPVTPQILADTDQVVTFGAHDLGLLHPGATYQMWPTGSGLDPDRGPVVITELDARVQGLWTQLCARISSLPMPRAR